MAYIAIKCPKCGGSVQMDNNLDGCNCIYCGHLIDFKNTEEYFIKSLHKKIFNGRNNTPEFKTLLFKALSQNPENNYFKDLITSEIWQAKIVNGELIKYDANLTKVTLPDCVTKIKAHAFDKATKMSQIVIPKSVISIEDEAFKYDMTLTISTYINSYATKYAMTMPGDLELLDGSDDKKIKIQKIKLLHREIINHRNNIKNNIKELRQKDIKKNPLDFLFLFNFMAWLCSLWFTQINCPKFAIAWSFISFSSFFVYIPLINLRKRNQKKKMKKKLEKQFNFYDSLLNKYFTPLGMVNFKYTDGASYSETSDYDKKIRIFEQAKKSIININLDFMNSTQRKETNKRIIKYAIACIAYLGIMASIYFLLEVLNTNWKWIEYVVS